jgi:hypothetical protein
MNRVSVLGVFIDKETIDEMTEALFATGFVAVVFESKALAFTRTLDVGGILVDDKSYLAIVIDDVGFDFLIIRDHKLCFEYRNPWRNIADERGSISIDRFNESFATSLRQVINFYSEHWADPLAGIVLSAVALGDEAARLVSEATPVPILSPSLNFDQVITGEWLVALGSGLRGLRIASKDINEISLLGEEAQEMFENHRTLHFLSFWSLTTPAVLGVLVIVFVGANSFIAATQATVAKAYQAATASNQGAGRGMSDLVAEATDFNRSVTLIASIENGHVPSSMIIENIMAAASVGNVTVTHVTTLSSINSVSVSGTASSESEILAFKSALEAISLFGTVSLPLSSIQSLGANYSFTMTVPLEK